jgi:hypothetical protein
MIGDLLGEPDQLWGNGTGRHPTRLYLLRRVEAAEATDTFKAALAKAEHRKHGQQSRDDLPKKRPL